MATKFCMRCGGEFIASVEECPDCELPLVDEPATVFEPEAGDNAGSVEYQLHTWAVESRVMLEGLLSSAGIRHAWEGADLVVSAAVEARVDAMVGQVEATTLPALDPDEPKVAYGVEDWSDEQQTELVQSLEEIGVPYEFDIEGALVVLEIHEDRVDAILDSFGLDDDADADDTDSDASNSADLSDDDDDSDDDDSDADDSDDDDDSDVDDSDYDGPEAMDVLSDLFVAADRLKNSATDAEGVLSLVARAGDADRMPLPYGFNRKIWADIIIQIDGLRDLLEDNDSADEAIEEHAHVLRDTLRNYV